MPPRVIFQTASTTRIDNSGNLTNIGTIAASGNTTIGGTLRRYWRCHWWHLQRPDSQQRCQFHRPPYAVAGANALTLGTTGTNTGAIVFKGSTAASGTVILQGPNNPSPSNYTLTIPNLTANDTICTQSPQ